jgi:hypothetical protein
MRLRGTESPREGCARWSEERHCVRCARPLQSLHQGLALNTGYLPIVLLTAVSAEAEQCMVRTSWALICHMHDAHAKMFHRQLGDAQTLSSSTPMYKSQQICYLEDDYKHDKNLRYLNLHICEVESILLIIDSNPVLSSSPKPPCSYPRSA